LPIVSASRFFCRALSRHFAVLLEVHQPVRHLQVRHVEDQAGVAERSRVFPVRVDHDDVPVGRGVADAVQDQRGAGRLAGAGRTEQREMLAEHRVDVDAGADVLGWIDGPHLDVGAPIARIDLPEVRGGRGIDQRARDRIAGDTAAEAVDAPGQLLLVAFAEEVDVGDDPCPDTPLRICDEGHGPDAVKIVSTVTQRAR
jgi:hypothetical protein